jgi:hypothetical protein
LAPALPDTFEDRLQELRDIAYQLRANPELLAEPYAKAQQTPGCPSTLRGGRGERGVGAGSARPLAVSPAA